MGDPMKFKFISEYDAFNFSLISLLCAEIFIFLYTLHNSTPGKVEGQDHGTKWLLFFNFIACIFISFYSVSQAAPAVIRQTVFPSFVADIGIFFILLGTIIRLRAVLTLKQAFTLNVQTTKEQHLVTSGLYRRIRHPAYSGSIVSLVGVALALRNILALCLVFFCCLFCYRARIRVEERALQTQFREEYVAYKKETYPLFPRIPSPFSK